MNQIIEVFDDFSAEKFIDAVELSVNNFAFNTEKTAEKLTEMPKERQILLQKAIESCIYTLATTDRIDGRNELSAEVSKKLNPTVNPMPEVGTLFLRVHPTLQQAAMKLFCCYLDHAKTLKYKKEITALRKDFGSHWYCFPLI